MNRLVHPHLNTQNFLLRNTSHPFSQLADCFWRLSRLSRYPQTAASSGNSENVGNSLRNSVTCPAICEFSFTASTRNPTSFFVAFSWLPKSLTCVLRAAAVLLLKYGSATTRCPLRRSSFKTDDSTVSSLLQITAHSTSDARHFLSILALCSPEPCKPAFSFLKRFSAVASFLNVFALEISSYISRFLLRAWQNHLTLFFHSFFRRWSSSQCSCASSTSFKSPATN